MEEFILDKVLTVFWHFASTSPKSMAIVSVIGLLRIIVPPVRDTVKAIIRWTDTKADDEALENVNQSKAGVMLKYILNWFLSIK